MLKIVFLGTSGSAPTKSRGMPCVALEYEGGIYLFDCGEGTQRQIIKYGVNISKVRAVFLSHMHGDHVIGVAGLIRTLALNGRTTPLYIYVPKGAERGIASLVTFDRALIKYEVSIRGISPREVFKGNGFIVRAFAVSGTTLTYGYTFKEDDKIHFIKEKCDTLKIKGRMFSQLAKRGSLKLGGKVVRLKDVTLKEKGLKVVYATDTRPVASTLNEAKEADLLIHESSFAGPLRALAKERRHSTASEIANLAKKAKVKRLVLFHISTRYRSAAPLQKEAGKIFENTEVAKDGTTITLK